MGAEYGPYRVLAELGKGGMGQVLRAEHAETGQRVAIKTVRAAAGAATQHLRREIHALVRLRHPGVIRVIDHGVRDGAPWYAMELLDGATLRQHMGRGLPEALSAVRRLCTPLAYVHGEGVVHRDLKPDNVIVAAGGRPVLIDFGLTGRLGLDGRDALELDNTGGTVWYMAPEQVRGDLVDARADLYALGCMLYETVTGEPPFVGTAEEVQHGHLHERPRPVSERVPGLPPGLEALIGGLLAKRPDARVGHAGDVASALADLGASDCPWPEAPAPREYVYRPRLAGRRRALGDLLKALARAQVGRGGLVLVDGEAGIGKTRLLLELTRRARDEGVTVLTGGVDAGGRALLGALKGPLQALGDRCRQFGRGEAERVFGHRGPVLALFEPSLADLPGQEAHEPPAPLAADAAHQRLYAYVGETLAEAARDRPVLLVLDDLHWADELTLGLLEHWVRVGQLAGLGLLVVGACRGDEAAPRLAGLLAEPSCQRLPLDRMDQRDVAQVVGDMLAVRAPAPALVTYLTDRSAGNPFFLAEYVRSAMAAGLLTRDRDGAWALGTSADSLAVPLPTTIRELVGGRLALLSARGRGLLQAAAVLGGEPETDTLAALVGDDETDLWDSLGELVTRQVLEEGTGGRWRFLHDHIRAVAYDGIEPARRAELHGAAAAALEAGPGDRAALLPLLGHHFEQAGMTGRARESYLGAAQSALARYAYDEAERSYRAYLRLVDVVSAESVEARNQLAHEVLRVRGRPEEAQAEHRRALDEAGQLGDDALVAASLQGLSAAAWRVGRVDETLRLGEEALVVARRAGAHEVAARSLQVLASAHWRRGEIERAEELVRDALGTYRTMGDRRGEAEVLVNLGAIFLVRDQLDEAEKMFVRSRALHEQRGYRRGIALVSVNLSIIATRRGRPEEAAGLLEVAVADLRAAGDYFNLTHALLECAVLDRRVFARLPAAHARLAEVEAICRDLADPVGPTYALCERGHLALAEGRSADDLVADARRRHAELGGAPQSELAQALGRLERAAAAHAAGEPLVAGELLADWPAGLIRWWRGRIIL